MNIKMRLNPLFLFVLLVSSFVYNEVASAAGGPVTVLEILFLHKGKTREEAEQYFYDMAQITQRYGARDNVGAYLKRWLKGGSDGLYNADFIVSTQFPSQAALNKMLQKDKDYDKILFVRDKIFDSAETIMFSIEPLEDRRPQK